MGQEPIFGGKKLKSVAKIINFYLVTLEILIFLKWMTINIFSTFWVTMCEVQMNVRNCSKIVLA